MAPPNSTTRSETSRAIGAQRLDPLDRLDVQDRPDVQAADVGMTVAGRATSVAGHDPLEPLVERRQTVDRDGRVLDEGDRLGVADHPHQEREPGLADLPEVVLGRVGQALTDAEHAGAALEAAGQVVGPVGQLVGRVGVELGGEDGLGPPRGEAQMPGHLGVAGREVEDRPVEHLDGHRAGLEDLARAGPAPPGSSRTRGPPAPARAASARPSARPR